MRPLSLIAALALLQGQAQSGRAPSPTVAGRYATVVTLLSSTCAGQGVEQHPTTVAHATGSAKLSLTHAGSTYEGTLRDDGTFATTAVTQEFDGVRYTIAISGRFRENQLDATVRVDALKQPPCQFTARWSGKREAEAGAAAARPRPNP